ncbi:uncharacterized protein EAE97_002317 [Botrytis byssoidea]|uniref:Uncharacterized protein n=1 Tax=Botrytis byssoidea TaxID=139641 RepID=A0A9P5M8N0_9HELO|nr:uncharacterized protein EAE97_002317 [Botrytis byssoidea]KAF7950765.1 hypothetical protein EAE97_002317 [Botrytis byssoidea]
MSLSTLQPNALYIALFTRGYPNQPDDFHWALYLHHNAQKGGIKYHVRNRGAGWTVDHGSTKGILKEALLVGLVQIAVIPDGEEGYVNEVFRSLDGTLNEREITCRTWILRVLEPLMRGGKGEGEGEGAGVKILGCESIEGLEREVKDFGNRYMDEANENVQPRLVEVSRVCGL